ncbi:hypothetical protein MOJ68_07275 [Actinobacillus pleuropneumoniae]|uniref:Lipid A core - O-antigen ligase and related enzymes n=1 Tax=Actinobacillus pleuropneumoniae TaxID=715 RepID=A0ABM6X555_ACTPL|nr:hypothetical protein [Actinobacillus pleuropneumoniae]ASU14847.1 hypothetical protein CHY23_00030 [Actinobacillus pleuropneumoniae]AWG95459.1 hypothetical protein APPSER1_05625 [Actinobacillus pleuropneumoniae serovar 1 str. 4074]AXA21530.1 hypothetical protein DRF63_05620 [Actinobacillus pleuropneumoniae]MBL4535491.1 hypothetical protein [Actinobacillus pleuropneumoniae]MCI1069690.1 hypothetical protein [Actinobacillus pleuropneumoniae]
MTALINLFYIYDPWFFHIVRMSLLTGFLALLWLGYKWYNKTQKSFVLPIDSLIVCIALIGLSVIPLLINGTREFGVISMYVKLLIAFIFGIVIYNLFYQTEQGKANLIRDLKIGIGVQATIGFLALLGITLFIELALNTNAEMRGHLSRFIGSEQEYRLYNLTSSAFFPLSIFYMLLLHFLLAYHHKTEKLNAVYVFLLLFIGLIAGRTFLTFSIVSLVLYFRRHYLTAIIAFAAVVLFLAYNYPTHPYVEHALEPVINLINGGDRLSSSTDTLMNKHLFMPEVKQLIMGDGQYYVNGGSYYGGSDSGFIRQALYGGIGYIFVCFIFTAYFVKRVADNWLNGSWKFTLSTLALLSVLNIKADTYAYPGIMFVLLMFLSLFGTSGRIKTFFNKNNEAKNV